MSIPPHRTPVFLQLCGKIAIREHKTFTFLKTAKTENRHTGDAKNVP